MACILFDCFSGAAGDMLVAALLDLGAPFDGLEEDLGRLGVGGFTLAHERRWQGGLAGIRFHVRIDAGARPPRRNLASILALLESSSLPRPVVERASAVFRRLGQAEAKVHGCSIDEVHFHEVGALDSIADVVGFCALHERLGAPRLRATPIAVGEGFVETEHGSLPVPAMATLELLRGVPIESGGLREELCTPTGAALLSTLCESFGRDFAYVPRAVGYGLGSRERASPPNAVRAILCDPIEPEGEPVTVLETNLDDATGQETGRLVELCLEAGALDAVVFPVLMKKGRPGVVVQVLAERAQALALEELLLRESPTLGVRRMSASRRVLPRVVRPVRTSLGEVRAKIATGVGGERRVALEFDDLAELARRHHLPIAEARRRVAREVEAALADELARAPRAAQ